MIQKFKEKIRGFIYKIISPPFVPPSYSQAGEDAILRFLFREMRMPNIKYLDIGTNIPDHGNNTYLFYKQGSRGVCVEADASLINDIKTARPQDKVIHAGVSVHDEKETDFYIFDEPSINTFDKKEAEYRNSLGSHKMIKVVKVPMVNINDLIKSNFENYPHLLSIDIEGLDMAVLSSLDYSSYPIPVICVETCTYSETHIRPKDTSVAEMLKGKGYETYADTYINTIFINKKWFYDK